MRESQKHIERLNIPVSNSLLHNQEHKNTLNLVRFHSERRRATSEKNINKMTYIYDDTVLRLRSCYTEYVNNKYTLM